MGAAIFNALSNVCFWLAVRFGSKTWGGVDGAYRHFRAVRQKEFEWWLQKDKQARESKRFGDLDDCATAAIKGNQRYEIEQYHILETLWTVAEKIPSVIDGDRVEALAMVESVIYILEHGHAQHETN